MINRLNILKEARSQYPNNGVLVNAIKQDKELRNEIDMLTKHFLKRSVSGCSSCYADAYLELISLNMEKATKIDECKFRLLAGAMLYDNETPDKSYQASNYNLTNELALYHLNKYPARKELFQVLPENLEELLKEYNGEEETAEKPKRKRKAKDEE